ncbi:MAG: ABC transporter ATP-binding protein [Acidimicrobiaceae bacterium]|nr:ABC transporter ATP-binding protein [Acidimicrobiaceae bacterium]
MKLELRGITKRFGTLVANHDVNLVVNPGEIHCLLGENGAGKSTLMNILYGLLIPDEGQILIDDEVVTIRDPKDAVGHGVGMVHQHFMLIPVFNVVDNVILGSEPVKPWPVIDYKAAAARLLDLANEYNFEIDPQATIENLPIGTQQRVEILKALSHHASVLILDEPTAVLTPQETDAFMVILRSLKESGKSIIFITHKLREVLALADVITVMRLGEVVGVTTPAQADERKLATMMVGRDVNLMVDKAPASPGEVVLDVRGIYVEDERGLTSVKNVSFEVRAGEILAVAGVQGNGQTELVEALTGMRRPSAGRITLNGVELAGEPVRRFLDAGIGHVPEDRQRYGLVPTLSISDNLVLDQLDDPRFRRRFGRNLKAIKNNGVQLVERYDIRAQSEEVAVSALSGGNQQKVVMARELSRELKLLICSQPTRGLDVGSVEFMHRQIVAIRDSGVAVIIVSSELDEVVALGDRIAVLYDGDIQAIVPPTTSREELGLLMAGARAEQVTL